MSLLTLSRKDGEWVRLEVAGILIWVGVSHNGRHQRITIDAPREVIIHRDEVLPPAERHRRPE